MRTQFLWVCYLTACIGLGWFWADADDAKAETRYIKQQAIDHGHAHYNQQTGKFEWNTPAECGQQQQERQD